MNAAGPRDQGSDGGLVSSASRANSSSVPAKGSAGAPVGSSQPMSRSPANTTMTTAGVTSEDCMSRMFRARCRPGIGVTPEQRPRAAQRLEATWETLRMPGPGVPPQNPPRPPQRPDAPGEPRPRPVRAESRFDEPVLRERDGELAALND